MLQRGLTLNRDSLKSLSDRCIYLTRASASHQDNTRVKFRRRGVGRRGRNANEVVGLFIEEAIGGVGGGRGSQSNSESQDDRGKRNVDSRQL